MHLGEQIVEWLFRDQLKVDAEWSVRTPRGFRWWADRNMQTVEFVGQTTNPDGLRGYLISVKTEVLRSLDLDERALALINLVLGVHASMAGPVYEESTRTLSLCSLVIVHDEISEWMKRMISVAAALQIGEARIVSPHLAEMLGAEEALSSPPGRPLRSEPDELAELIAVVIAPEGRKPSQWTPRELRDVVKKYLSRPPARGGHVNDGGLAVEFPFGDGWSLCEAVPSANHPRYGNGLLVLQSFPIGARSEKAGYELVLELNRHELTERPFGYGFGSYAYMDGKLYFACFLPNILYKPNVLANMCLACGARAAGLSAFLTSPDEARASPTETGLGTDDLPPEMGPS